MGLATEGNWYLLEAWKGKCVTRGTQEQALSKGTTGRAYGSISPPPWLPFSADDSHWLKLRRSQRMSLADA